jgi:hypothetical protein
MIPSRSLVSDGQQSTAYRLRKWDEVSGTRTASITVPAQMVWVTGLAGIYRLANVVIKTHSRLTVNRLCGLFFREVVFFDRC